MKIQTEFPPLPEDVDLFYREFYDERWEGLKQAIFQFQTQVAWLNPFEVGGAGKTFSPYPHLSGAGVYEGGEPPTHGSQGYLEFYVMDPASIFAALALGVQKGDRVLDLCAAPGGKTLILSQALAEEGELVANDVSPNRRQRLKKVLSQYLPESLLERVRVTGHDGSRWGLHEKASFDKVLLDAPCSGEKYLFQSAKELKQWKPKRSKGLAQRQWALLAAAFDVVRPGGSIIYSTCALSPLENDAVIQKLFKKRKDLFEIECVEAPIGEPTEYGWQILPDKENCGPIYYAKIIRKVLEPPQAT